MSILKVQVKTVYGSDLIYPRNAEAMVLAQIGRSKTLSLETVTAAVKVLGMELQVVHAGAAIVEGSRTDKELATLQAWTVQARTERQVIHHAIHGRISDLPLSQQRALQGFDSED